MTFEIRIGLMARLCRAITVCTFFLGFALFAQALPLSEKRLAQGKWNAEPNHPGYEYKLSFKKGVAKYIQAIAELDVQAEGLYTIDNGAVVITGFKRTSAGIDGEVPGDLRCTLLRTEESLQYAELLSCQPVAGGNKVDFYDTGALVKTGAERMVDGIAVIYSPAFKKPTTTLIVRKAPSKSSEALSWNSQKKDGTVEERKNLRKGEKVTVLARTREKLQVDKWNNYWYYVEIDAVDAMGNVPLSERGWVFGEFLK